MPFAYDEKSVQDTHLSPILFHKLSYMSHMILTLGMQLIKCINHILKIMDMGYGNSRKTTCTHLGDGEALSDFNNTLPPKTVDSEARIMS